MLELLAGILLIGVLVTVHEFGHFVVAKLAGVKVEVFSIGFGAPILKAQWGETEYRLAWLPVGGYVRMLGMDPTDVAEPEDIGRSLYDKRPITRMLIYAAGPAMNIVLPLLIVALFVALTWWLQRSWKTCLLVLLGFLFILNQGYWEETTECLTLVLAACVVCMAIGVPIGIAAAHRPGLYRVMRPVLDLMQTLPTFVYLIPAIVFFGIGMVPGLIATVIFVLPAPIRLTHLGVSSTPAPLVEACRAFGGDDRQILWKVELPYALPQIMAGLNQTIMLSLSMVVIAALVGADGLGVPVVRALNQVNTALGFESGFIIVVVAIMLDRMLRIDGKNS